MTTVAPARTEATPALAAGTIRVAVIGCGYWGPKLARNFGAMSDACLSIVADLRPERLAEMRKLHPDARTVRDHLEVISADVDAVAIATPVHTHYKLAKAALEAGKHVLVEKPITARADQARELIELAAEKHLTLMVGHTFLYNPAVEAVRRIIQSGELGRMYYLNTTRVNLGLLQPDINVMWDLAPHDLSILHYVLEANAVSVSARGAAYVNTTSNLPEVAYLVVRFCDGVIANLRLSWLDPVKTRRLTVVGSKKMLVYDDLAENKVIVYDHGVEVPPYSVTEDEFRASYRHGEETAVPLTWVEPLRTQCEDFLQCIRTGQTPRSSGQVGLNVVHILETAQRSLVNGGVELAVEYS